MTGLNLTSIFNEFTWLQANLYGEDMFYMGMHADPQWTTRCEVTEKQIELKIYLNGELAQITTYVGDVINLIPLAIRLARNS